MKTYTRIVCEGELLGPVDWNYDFMRHFSTYGSNDEARKGRCAKCISFLRQISEGEPSDWEVLLSHSDWWKQLYSVGMYDGWPFWVPTPAVMTSGVLGAEWHFFYDLQDCRIRQEAHP